MIEIIIMIHFLTFHVFYFLPVNFLHWHILLPNIAFPGHIFFISVNTVDNNKIDKTITMKKI